ncbi:MAG: RdgB/HAM1 family non-canonical purine NTP pyrophosphatase [Alphaproteobacteria bacterium]
MLLNNAEIVLATHNKGKIPEISALVEPFGCIVSCAGDYGVSEPIEDGDTFEANALLKAWHTAKATGKIAMADDSGICVVGLDNAPGIYSARYAGQSKDFNIAMKRIEDELNEKGTDEKGAFFVCSLAVVNPTTGEELVFRGEVHGNLTFPARGDKGFGYDPIFIPNGYDITFAEMDADKKHSISHRADAFNKMKETCFAK